MLNILSYIGVNLQSELCLWTLLGLMRTIFDATLFRVNANLKQVWQMSMPAELSMPVQRGLRTMISGVMLVQCFTVYVYLAAYIVLLYPVFLEERPILVLPWLLLAAIRKFLCELMSLVLGLGTCLLLGPARPPCIKFVVFKVASITPAFYMWMLVFSYYNNLKVATAFKRFPTVMATNDQDYGLELAVRRRRTKSLQDEDQLRRKLVASLNYDTRPAHPPPPRPKTEILSHMIHSTNANIEDMTTLKTWSRTPSPTSAERVLSDVGSYEDWCGSEITVPRDTDRILEQFVIMSLRIGAYLKNEGTDPSKMFNSSSRELRNYSGVDCSNLQNEEAETPLLVGNTKGKTASYLQEYPQIFMKKPSDTLQFLDEPKLTTKQSKHALRNFHGNEADNQNTSSPKAVKIFDKIDRESSAAKLLYHANKPGQSLKTNNEKEIQKKLSILKMPTKSTRQTNVQTDTKSNKQTVKTDKLNNEKSLATNSFISQTIEKIIETYNNNRMEVNAIERDLKQVSQETYHSYNPNIQDRTCCKTDNIKIILSDDSIDGIIERMKKNLPTNLKSLIQDEIVNEADQPTSTRALNDNNLKLARSHMTTNETNEIMSNKTDQSKTTTNQPPIENAETRGNKLQALKPSIILKTQDNKEQPTQNTIKQTEMELSARNIQDANISNKESKVPNVSLTSSSPTTQEVNLSIREAKQRNESDKVDKKNIL